MFQVDEKVIADNRTLITIQDAKENINAITKNGTIHYTMKDNNLWLTTPKIRQTYIKKGDVLAKYDKIIIARNGTNIDGSYVFDEDQIFGKNVEIKKNLIVKGDFSVEGNSSIIDTPKLTIEDNVIELNRNETADGITLNNAGMALNRGTKPFARYLYNEPTKAFVLDTNTSMDADVDNTKWVLQAHTENNDGHIAGEVRVKEKLTVPVGNITNNLSVANTTTSRILNILETSTFAGASTFNNTVSVAGVLTAKNNVIAEKLLNVRGAATFDSTVLIKSALTVNDVSTFKKKSDFLEGIEVTSTGDQCAIFRKNVSMASDAEVAGVLTVLDNGVFNSDVMVENQISSAFAVIENTLTSNEADINLMRVNEQLDVTGPSTFTGNVAITGTNFNVNAASVLNGTVNINGLLTAEENVVTNKNLTVNQNLTVKGTANITGATNITGDLTANNLTAKVNVSTLAGDGNGYRFSNSDLYKIYMSTTANSTLGGAMADAASSDYNMYFKMSNGTNRGFVYKNENNIIAQLEGSGILRTLGDVYARGSKVLRVADEGHGNGIDADTLDGLHKTDYVLRDGSQEMTGDLKLGLNKIRFSNDDYFYYDDGSFNIGAENYTGKYMFTSDNVLANSSVEAGAFKAGNIALSGKTDTLSGVKVLNGAFGTIAKSVDEWLRINDDASHTNGVFFGSSMIRTDNGINIGDQGSTLLINDSEFKYKHNNVITAAGGTMLGTLNLAKTKLLFGSSSDNTGTTGMAASDNGYIYGEHDEGVENSRLVIEVADNPSDMIVLRTSDATNKKDSFKVSYNRATFADNPYFNSNRLLHTGDMGSGNALDADTVDGKHYIDLQNEFVNVNGDTMTGKLTMNADIHVTPYNKIQIADVNSFIRSGGPGALDVVFGSAGTMHFYPGADSSKAMRLDPLGVLTVLGSKVLTEANEGHGNGIDADTIDGKHLSDLTTQFVDAAGDTMTGNLNISKSDPQMYLIDSTSKSIGRLLSSGGTIYLQAGRSDSDPSGNLMITGHLSNSLNSFNVKVTNLSNATINDQKILTVLDKGHGKGLDADTVDGKHATDFATSTHNHDTVYVKRTEVNLQDKYKIQYNSSTGSLDFMFMG